MKSHGSKHQLREPHIVISSSEQSATIRKALHSNSKDDKSLFLAPQNRTVSRKFIYRSKNSPHKTPNLTEDVEVDSDPDPPPPLPSALWHPIDPTCEAQHPQALPELIEDNQYDMLPVINFPLAGTTPLGGSQQCDQLPAWPATQGQAGAAEDIDSDVSLDIEEDIPNDVGPHPMHEENDSAVSLDTGEDLQNDVGLQDSSEASEEEDDVVDPTLERNSSMGSSTTNVSQSLEEAGVCDVVLFDAGEGLHEQERLNQSRALKKNDKLAFFNTHMGRWIKAEITSHAVRKKGWEDWFNYQDELGREGGAYFIKNERWTLLDKDDTIDHGRIHQVDGIEMPDSASPDTTPENKAATVLCTGARPKVRLDPSEYLSYTSDSDVEAAPDLNKAMDWDNYGTALECDVVCEDPPSYRLSIPLDQAVNLDCVLPLTSTPVPSLLHPDRRLRSRVSAPRRPLPGEVERKEASFLSRLNPFRKRN